MDAAPTLFSVNDWNLEEKANLEQNEYFARVERSTGGVAKAKQQRKERETAADKKESAAKAKRQQEERKAVVAKAVAEADEKEAMAKPASETAEKGAATKAKRQRAEREAAASKAVADMAEKEAAAMAKRNRGETETAKAAAETAEKEAIAKVKQQREERETEAAKAAAETMKRQRKEREMAAAKATEEASQLLLLQHMWKSEKYGNKGEKDSGERGGSEDSQDNIDVMAEIQLGASGQQQTALGTENKRCQRKVEGDIKWLSGSTKRWFGQDELPLDRGKRVQSTCSRGKHLFSVLPSEITPFQVVSCKFDGCERGAYGCMTDDLERMEAGDVNDNDSWSHGAHPG